MKLFEHWLHYSFDWKSLGLALLIVVISIVLVNGIVRGIFHQIEKRIPDRFAGWTDVLMAFDCFVYRVTNCLAYSSRSTFGDAFYTCDLSLSAYVQHRVWFVQVDGFIDGTIGPLGFTH